MPFKRNKSQQLSDEYMDSRYIIDAALFPYGAFHYITDSCVFSKQTRELLFLSEYLCATYKIMYF